MWLSFFSVSASFGGSRHDLRGNGYWDILRGFFLSAGSGGPWVSIVEADENICISIAF
jgi:hypothetical protein